jgi:hypothetical protein
MLPVSNIISMKTGMELRTVQDFYVQLHLRTVQFQAFAEFIYFFLWHECK